ncbi:hypothetical protein STSP2_01007 [Anaerohalosphaera lusitana]|uniref:DUF2905 domain-containing protein n=1 Tax=Anaerohalosphaera lusitana TaxID=1936003 RepID=A0A1U9NJ58_9BACT|nr:DUF2905 domain-containing protein [Anaerohalosphaera lusitana]AQT67855.1 hypothetical protein STSP2_01007 [Anaerohalosphaera lusitana]
MENFNPQQLGKLLLIIAAFIALLGLAMILLPRLGLFKLPGDIFIDRKNFKFYFPLATSIILSIILTAIFWLINHFSK